MRNCLRLSVAVGVMLFLLAGVARAQNDRIIDTVTGWSYYYGVGSAFITSQMNSGSRPFNITRVSSDSFDTVFVANSGAYSIPGATVYYGQTTSSLISNLSNNNMRILDLEAYDSGGLLLHAALVVPNSGATAAPGWGWLTNATFNDIVNWLNANPSLRLIDMDVFLLNGQQRYTAVAVPNTGANFQSGWWYAGGVTAAQVSADLAANNARLIDIDVVSIGTIINPTVLYNYIMVSNNPGAGVWHGSATSQQVADILAQYGTRLTCFKRYTTAFGQTRYAIAAVDNANAQTRRVRDLINASTDGVTGFRLKQVGGPVLADLNSSFVWEPASTIKLLHAVYAIYRCSLGLESLSSLVEYRNLSSNSLTANCTSCPFDWTCASRFFSLGTTIEALLEPSNNNALIALERRYTVSNLEAFADDHGFGSITIPRQNCDCGVVLNTATCVDICEMMEQVADGSLFNQGWQDTLYGLMNDLEESGYNAYSTLSAVINSEAALTNLTPAEITSFRNAMRFANKGGLYSCNSGLFWKTEGGWASVPFKINFLGSWQILPREYTFALFTHNATNSSGSNIIYSAKEEILREQIREALQSWDATCTTPTVLSSPMSITRSVGQSANFSGSFLGGGEGSAYRWQRVMPGGSVVWLIDVPGKMSGVFTPSLTISNLEANDAGQYRLNYSAVCGTVYSATATLTVVPAACPGDANGDGVVNFDDITAVLANWLGAGPTGDADHNGIVNFEDISTVIANWGVVCP